MKKIVELCILVAILVAFILFSCSNNLDLAEKQQELFEGERPQNSVAEENSGMPVEYEGI